MELRISTCPACGRSDFAVQRYVCLHCNTVVEGHFYSSRLANLSQEQIEFVEVFLKARGNIKEVERELGISYPTVRNRLDKVIARLGLRDDGEHTRSRLTILSALERNEMTPEEAVVALRDLSQEE